MKGFLVSDNHDSLVLLRLAGIPGVLAVGADETAAAVEDVLTRRHDVGVLVMTERAAEQVPAMVKSLREREELPLLVIIPDRHGARREADFLTRYIREAIGVRIN
ncbi:MAG: ATP synthase subunit F [Synergistaceae bacterium]|nr:V-type ATP synthase subunit F [Synergistota bacterium]NLM71021.1 ATP synthase subunit F [Synergistaceae bacterium]